MAMTCRQITKDTWRSLEDRYIWMHPIALSSFVSQQHSSPLSFPFASRSSVCWFTANTMLTWTTKLLDIILVDLCSSGFNRHTDDDLAGSALPDLRWSRIMHPSLSSMHQPYPNAGGQRTRSCASDPHRLMWSSLKRWCIEYAEMLACIKMHQHVWEWALWCSVLKEPTVPADYN